MDEKITHKQLVRVGMKWLTNTCHCGAVSSEVSSSFTMERPDVIGWKNGDHSTVIECKVSRSDFLAQRSKPHVIAGLGMGRRRYYLTPPKLVTREDLDGSDYGLLWFYPSASKLNRGHVSVLKQAEVRADYDIRSEMSILISIIRRMQLRDFLVIVPPDQIEEVMEVA